MLKKLSTKLEVLFDQSVHAQIPEPQEKKATAAVKNIPTQDLVINDNNSLKNLSYIYNGEVNQSQLSHLFSQICAHFEAGFLFEKNGAKSKIIDCYMMTKQIPDIANFSEIRLPQTQILKVLKMPGSSFLRKFNLQHLDLGEKTECYLIHLSPRHAIALISSLAEPWISVKLETLQQTLMKISTTT